MLTAPYRVAIVCDFLEENWPSMNLVADMLASYLARNHPAEITVTQLRPTMRRLFSRFGSQTLRNADRLWNRFYFYPKWLRKRKNDFDIFHIIDHSYAHLAFELPQRRTLITCHDLDTFRPLLETDRQHRHGWYRRFIRRTLAGLQKAPQIICVSQATRSALLHHELVPSNRVNVIYYGVHPDFLTPNAQADAKVARMLPNGSDGEICLLSVGSTIPRKRIDVLLRVFAAVREREPSAKLVRVGGDFTPSQERLAKELGVLDSILVFPFLDTGLLAAVYRRATLLLQTSEAEGFGLPLIEAMACGCPVIASDIPPLREVGGPATTLCPLGDIDLWARAVLRLLQEKRDSPPAWVERRNASSAWSLRFTWEENARRTAELYQRLIAAQPTEENQQ